MAITSAVHPWEMKLDNGSRGRSSCLILKSKSINDSDEMRYLLMLRTWHPDLTREEQEALQLIYDCLEILELLSSDPGTMLLAEQQAKSLREFPLRNSTAGDQNKRVKKQK